MLDSLKQKVQELEKQTSQLKGKLDTIEQQFLDNQNRISELKDLQITNKKAIELLNLVQGVTKDLIQNSFESIITEALQYVYQSDDYQFQLEFGRQGAKPKLTWKLKTNEMQESHDLMNTRAGGEKDIVALALRLVLLEVSKNKGFLCLDEFEKRLDSPQTLKNAIDFIKRLQKETGRQLFLITHKQEVVDAVENPIIFQKKEK